MRKTKIVCTLGPASTNEEVIEKMLRAGMNVARLNFSHGTHEEHEKAIDMFRRVRDRLELSAAVMLDTKGPEIRIGKFAQGHAFLNAGDTFTFTTEEIEGDGKRVSITYKDLPRQLKCGTVLLLDDGKLSFEVTDI